MNFSALSAIALFSLSLPGHTQPVVRGQSAGTKTLDGIPGEPVLVDQPSASAPPGARGATRQSSDGGAAFMKEASQFGMAEVELSKLAHDKAKDSSVKALAHDMVRDHTEANANLNSLAESRHIGVAASLDLQHAAKVRALGRKEGPAFDQAYLTQLDSDHKQAVELFQQQSKDANRELAAFASKTLPMLRHHQDMVAALKTPVQ